MFLSLPKVLYKQKNKEGQAHNHPKGVDHKVIILAKISSQSACIQWCQSKKKM
jgi:hypothetical protein